MNDSCPLQWRLVDFAVGTSGRCCCGGGARSCCDEVGVDCTHDVGHHAAGRGPGYEELLGVGVVLGDGVP